MRIMRSEKNMTDNRDRVLWRSAQMLSLALGIGELVLLFRLPTLGIHLLWNLLIPLAPLVVMLVPGVWRNICPLGVASQLPRRLRLHVSRRMSPHWQVAAMAFGWAALLIIVPMRHLWFDLSGPATAAILILLGAAALLLGLLFDGKSGWCSTACPVHIVEKLYGHRTALPVVNAHCDTCTSCVRFCPDSRCGPDRLSNGDAAAKDGREIIGCLMIGGFAGYIYGWFQCPDVAELTTAAVVSTFAWPFGGMLASLAAYLFLYKAARLPRMLLSRIFAGAAIGMYYWFRIPMLFGFGEFGLDGCLIDLADSVPIAAIVGLRAGVLLLIFVWLVLGLATPKPWMAPVRNAPATATSITIR